MLLPLHIHFAFLHFYETSASVCHSRDKHVVCKFLAGRAHPKRRLISKLEWHDTRGRAMVTSHSNIGGSTCTFDDNTGGSTCTWGRCCHNVVSLSRSPVFWGQQWRRHIAAVLSQEEMAVTSVSTCEPFESALVGTVALQDELFGSTFFNVAHSEEKLFEVSMSSTEPLDPALMQEEHLDIGESPLAALAQGLWRSATRVARPLSTWTSSATVPRRHR